MIIEKGITYLSASEAAAYLGISIQSLYNNVPKIGRIKKSLKPGGSESFYPVEDLDAYRSQHPIQRPGCVPVPKHSPKRVPMSRKIKDVVGDGQPPMEHVADSDFNVDLLFDLFSTLTERECKIIIMRWGISATPDHALPSKRGMRDADVADALLELEMRCLAHFSNKPSEGE